MRYAYLIYSLYFLGILGLILWRRHDLRAHAVPSMITGAIAGPVSELIYFRDYWRPQTIVGNSRLSPEDALFGAAIFGLAAVLYSFVSRKALTGNPGRSPMRSLMSVMPLGVLFAVLWAVGINSVFATIIAFAVGWIVLAVKMPHVRRPSMVTGGGFVVLALFIYGVGLNLLVPHEAFKAGWLLYGTPLGATVFGSIPVSELLWFFTAGLFLQAHFLYAHQKQYQPKGQMNMTKDLTADA